MEEVSKLITEKLETMVQPTNPDLIHSKRKAINTLFPYAVRLWRSGEQRMADMFLRAAVALNYEGLIWHRKTLLVMGLSGTQNPPFLNLLITLSSPHLRWSGMTYDGKMVARWAEAASAVPYAEGVGQSVVDTLLHIASVDSLRPHIPAGIWTWLKRQPSLPPECLGRSRGSSGGVVHQVRALGDTEILKSYLLRVWSEWDTIDYLWSGGLAEMKVSIREDFGGIAMWGDRQDLIERLDYVLGQLDGGLYHLRKCKPSLYTWQISEAKTQYSELMAVLLEVDAEAMDGLARKPPRLIFFGLLTPTDTYRIPLDLHVRSASTVSIVTYFGHLESLPPISDLVRILVLILLPRFLTPSLSPSSSFDFPRCAYTPGLLRWTMD